MFQLRVWSIYYDDGEEVNGPYKVDLSLSLEICLWMEYGIELVNVYMLFDNKLTREHFYREIFGMVKRMNHVKLRWLFWNLQNFMKKYTQLQQCARAFSYKLSVWIIFTEIKHFECTNLYAHMRVQLFLSTNNNSTTSLSVYIVLVYTYKDFIQRQLQLTLFTG